jgi:hypothetical protein
MALSGFNLDSTEKPLRFSDIDYSAASQQPDYADPLALLITEQPSEDKQTHSDSDSTEKKLSNDGTNRKRKRADSDADKFFDDAAKLEIADAITRLEMTARAQLEDAKLFTLNRQKKELIPNRVYEASESKKLTPNPKLTENYLQSNANNVLAEVERLKKLLTQKTPKKPKIDSVKNDGMLAMQDEPSASNGSSHNGSNGSTDKLEIPAEFAAKPPKSPGYGAGSPRMFSLDLPDADVQKPGNGFVPGFEL